MIVEQLSKPARHLIRRMRFRKLAKRAAQRSIPRHRRYLSDRPQNPEQLLRAAGDYVANLPGTDYLYLKPYDMTPGNRMFFVEMYQILNILRAMDLLGGSRVLEVGSGPGWVTEVLALMGFEVDALEPSQAMIDIARERMDACRAHHRLKRCRPVRFHCQTLEACNLPDETFDGVLFHESLHHIIDEHAGLRQVFRMLRPGGIIGVSGEPVWRPGDREVEQSLEQEMQRFGVLESPFTIEYLDFLLRECGFESVVRYVGVNGLFPVEESGRRLADVAMFPPTDYQALTASKPGPRRCTTTQDHRAAARGELRVLQVEYDAARMRATVTVRLENCGKVTWAHSDRLDCGFVTLALRQGQPGTREFREAEPRARLRQSVPPGDSVTIEHTFAMPWPPDHRPWTLDLVNEQHYWFSTCGTTPVDLVFPNPD